MRNHPCPEGSYLIFDAFLLKFVKEYYYASLQSSGGCRPGVIAFELLAQVMLSED